VLDVQLLPRQIFAEGVNVRSHVVPAGFTMPEATGVTTIKLGIGAFPFVGSSDGRGSWKASYPGHPNASLQILCASVHSVR
jgi:hypothetical protein